VCPEHIHNPNTEGTGKSKGMGEEGGVKDPGNFRDEGVEQSILIS